MSQGSKGSGGAEPAAGCRAGRRTATTTLLLRHGQTALSVERRFAGRGDIPLTDIGPQQAAAAGNAQAARLRVQLVGPSRLARARRTARALSSGSTAVS